MSVFASAALVGGLNMGLSALSQSDAIEQANKFNKAMRDAEVLNTTYENTTRTFKQVQVEDQIKQQKVAVKLQALEKQGEARARGGASGLTGRSINKLSQRFQEQAAQAISTLSKNMSNSRASYNLETKAAQRATQSRIDSQMQRPEFSWSSVLASGIQGAATGASIGSSLKIGAENGVGSPGVGD